QTYEEFGGIAGAISHAAQNEMIRLTPEQRLTARRIFTRLVRIAPPEEGGRDTRRRASLEEFGPAARPLVEQLAHARLLIMARDDVTGEETVEAQDALVREWSDLRNWLNEDREFLLWRQRL